MSESGVVNKKSAMIRTFLFIFIFRDGEDASFSMLLQAYSYGGA